MISGVDTFNHHPRIQQLQIHRGRNQRVPEKRLVLPHGILPLPEQGQPVHDEVVQGMQGIFRCNGPVEMIERSGMVRKKSGDIRTGLLCQFIGWKTAGPWNRRWSGGAKTGAVFGIEVPLASYGLTVLHQITCALTHPAIKELHAQAVSSCLVAACGPGLEIREGAKKVRVGPDFQPPLQLSRTILQSVRYADIARLQNAEAVDVGMLSDEAGENF